MTPLDCRLTDFVTIAIDSFPSAALASLHEALPTHFSVTSFLQWECHRWPDDNDRIGIKHKSEYVNQT